MALINGNEQDEKAQGVYMVITATYERKSKKDKSIEKGEAINELNNNASVCIHCHTLILCHHQDCLSDTHTDCPSGSRFVFWLHHPPPSPPFCVFFSLRLGYLHHHVTTQSILLNLLWLLFIPASPFCFPALCVCLFLCSSHH